MQLEKIAPENQKDVIHAFWGMMMELESAADNEDDIVLKHFVTGYFRVWNRMTGDDKVPKWVTRSQQSGVTFAA